MVMAERSRGPKVGPDPERNPWRIFCGALYPAMLPKVMFYLFDPFVTIGAAECRYCIIPRLPQGVSVCSALFMNLLSMKLSHKAAQALMLAAQGLDRRPSRLATKSSVLETIRRMEVLQIDTIHVVARSPYLVLWSRLGDYNPRWLDELLADGALFEYWAHEASFLPIEDYPLFRHRMIDPLSMKWKYSQRWVNDHREHIDRMLLHIRERGPVRSADFVRNDGITGGWWEWKPEKKALEMLFTAGDLMVARRHNFQRIYDLRERVLPSWNDRDLPPIGEVKRRLVLKAVRALGIAPERWVADYFRTRKAETKEVIAELLQDGALLQASVEGWDMPGLIHPENGELAAKAAAGRIRPSLTTLLSPFDPLVWDRARASAMFGFDYTLECYTPAPRRRYGYFTLPILRRGELIGRLDPKAHRKDGRFEVKTIHLEDRVEVTDEVIADVAAAIRECAIWHDTPEVSVVEANVPGLASALQVAANRGAR